MERPVRAALAGLDDGTLHERVQALPLRPEVQVYGSLYTSIAALAVQPPDVLLAAARPDDGDLPGALRLLRGLLPGTGIVLVGQEAHELALAPIAARAQAQLLVMPCIDGALAAAIERALTGSDRPPAGAYLDLAHGIADAILNPLLTVNGHLQLLQLQLDATTDAGRRASVDAALAGSARIQQIVDTVHLAARAAEGPRQRQPVDLRALLHELLEGGPFDCEPDGEPLFVHGDRELLTPALHGFVQLLRELRELGTTAAILLSRFRAAVRVRLRIDPPGLPQWRLPRTFEPYYLNRWLRGTPHGLALFVAQTVVLGHGGQATARRLGDGTLALDLLLPAS